MNFISTLIVNDQAVIKSNVDVLKFHGGDQSQKKYFVLFSDCLCVCLRLCACVFSVRVDVFCVLVCFLHFQWLLLTLPTSAFFQLSLLLSGIWDLVFNRFQLTLSSTSISSTCGW